MNDTETTYAWTVTLPTDLLVRDQRTYIAPTAYVTSHGALVIGEVDENNECLAPVAMFSSFGWASCLRSDELVPLRELDGAA